MQRNETYEFQWIATNSSTLSERFGIGDIRQSIEDLSLLLLIDDVHSSLDGQLSRFPSPRRYSWRAPWDSLTTPPWAAEAIAILRSSTVYVLVRIEERYLCVG